MKKSNLTARLQQQYNKLQTRINKAIKSGKFYQYTAYKQQQLQARLQRYALQLRQLAKGVAVCAALGVALPASAQIAPFNNLVERTGLSNPFDTIDNYGLLLPEFVDLDGDNDLDLVYYDAIYPSGVYTRSAHLFENISNTTTPEYVKLTGANNPLDGINNKSDFSFVDIDNDGDFDLFASNYCYKDTSAQMFYYENIGSATNANYVLQSTSPLDSIAIHLSTLPLTTSLLSPLVSFVDIDADGDYDVFCGIYEYAFGPNFLGSNSVWYYENQGTVTSPIFRRQTTDYFSSEFLSSTNSTNFSMWNGIQFKDFDSDGDYDALITGKTDSTGSSSINFIFENTGNPNSPSFVYSTTTPWDLVLTTNYSPIKIDDIDGDSDLDLINPQGGGFSMQYFENLEFTNLIQLKGVEELEVFPNPSLGLIHFKEAVHGRLSVYDRIGNLMKVIELQAKQSVDLGTLPNGLYMLVLDDNEEQMIGKFSVYK